MSGFGFWGGPEGVEIPMPRIEGQEDRPYFHGGPGFRHSGPAYQCFLAHPGDPEWIDQEVLEALNPEEESEEYIPRHMKPGVVVRPGDDINEAIALAAERVVYPFGDPSGPAMLVQPEGYELKYIPPKVAPRSTLLWVGVDLDGTIAEPLWTPGNPTSEIGEPIWRNLGKLIELTEHGYKIVVHTSRPWTDYEAIETWLNHHQIPWSQIQCGKPLFALYVDDHGRNAEEESWLP